MGAMKGKVYLVGAGPGDPGLITVKGLECIQHADVIIYDYLAHPSLLHHAKADAEIIYVGKKGGDHTLSQDEINKLIVDKANINLTVTRLKGGDPFIFGRGAEEAEVLKNNGVYFEIVPGVTSAIAAPAYAGIPLTHRKLTSTLAFVTGHEDPTKGIGTIVFLMGVKNLPQITSQLIKHGMSPETPAALIRWGTTPKQVTITGTIDTIVEKAKSANIKPPAIFVVGQVIDLRETLQWFENRPLMGKRIVVTRAREQASEFVKLLSDLGADCLEYPTIKMVPPSNVDHLDKAIENISTYDWLVFTSVNGVTYFFERLFKNGKDVRALNHLHTATIGPATAKRLLDFGIQSDIIPRTYRAESIIESFENKDVKDKKILLPRAKEARPILPVELNKMGAAVDEVTAYCTEQALDNIDDLLSQLENNEVDLITFTSSSTVKNFKNLLPEKKIGALLENVTVASIGPITSDTAKNLGFNVHITAESYTIQGLCQAILDYYKKH
ncbi:MAG: uroporphyrinogen-III C-methyltransferase [Deltaproteobacteria bacterium]|nr:uroporphyrinogen-III C-methyltransferase [Deltaproteobacteria bacterium]